REELRSASREKFLILAVHHTIYSFGRFGSSSYLQNLLAGVFREAGRVPDAVFTADAHNYQRIAGYVNGVRLTFFNAGAGGYYNLHHVDAFIKQPVLSGLSGPAPVLEQYDDRHHGYLRVEATPTVLTVHYLAVSPGQSTQMIDTCEIRRR